MADTEAKKGRKGRGKAKEEAPAAAEEVATPKKAEKRKSTEAGDEGAPVKRGRGRPKGTGKKAAAKPKGTGKGRGRPKKNKEESAEEQSEDQDAGDSS